MITEPNHAEKLLQENQADLIFIGRELLRNPYWSYQAAKELHTPINFPKQYHLAFRNFFKKEKL
ncbi:NADH:flavin oxidoreductase-like protein [Enterococcus durans IPLA 655]|nr:NADH:flavin oxidoreductase-like protein [Enterococcus durans IPLA 655]